MDQGGRGGKGKEGVRAKEGGVGKERTDGGRQRRERATEGGEGVEAIGGLPLYRPSFLSHPSLFPPRLLGSPGALRFEGFSRF